MKQLKILSSASWQICTAETLRQFMHLDDGADIETLEYYISVATSLFEDMTHHIIQEKHYQLTYDTLDRIDIPLVQHPLQEVIAVWMDERLLLPDTYHVHEGRIYLSECCDYPITVEYKAGYASADDVSIGLKHILMMCAADLYLYRLGGEAHYHFSDRINHLISQFQFKSI
ncbi:MAG: hypothetical protein AAF621_03700 [Pseudomonadota bacterium]